MNPSVSIIIPTRGRTTELIRAVHSCLNQDTNEEFEILIINDNEIGDAFDQKVLVYFSRCRDARLSVIRNLRGRGGSGARNTGVFAARGQWVAFLDDDDEWLPTKLSQQMRHIVSSGESVNCLDTGFYRISPDRAPVEVRPAMSGSIFHKLLFKESSRAPKLSTFICRKELLIGIGGFDESLLSRQDLDLYLRLAQKTSFYSINDCLVFGYTNSAARISKNPTKKALGGIAFERKWRRFLKQDPRRHSKLLFHLSYKSAQALKPHLTMKLMARALGTFLKSLNPSR